MLTVDGFTLAATAVEAQTGSGSCDPAIRATNADGSVTYVTSMPIQDRERTTRALAEGLALAWLPHVRSVDKDGRVSG